MDAALGSRARVRAVAEHVVFACLSIAVGGNRTRTRPIAGSVRALVAVVACRAVRLELTGARAAVAVREVAVVALLARVDDLIAATPSVDGAEELDADAAEVDVRLSGAGESRSRWFEHQVEHRRRALRSSGVPNTETAVRIDGAGESLGAVVDRQDEAAGLSDRPVLKDRDLRLDGDPPGSADVGLASSRPRADRQQRDQRGKSAENEASEMRHRPPFGAASPALAR
jgi:hypothetical protein